MREAVCAGLLWVALGAGHAAHAQGPPPEVVAGLTAEYGRYYPARHCWAATGRDANAAVAGCIAVVRADQVETSTGKRVYAMLSGAGPQDCHVCNGLIAFAVFDVTGPPRLIAASPATPDGAYGKPSDAKAVVVRQLGSDLWGWVEESGYSAQGETESGWTIWLPRGEQIVRAGTLSGSHDNSGACGKEAGPSAPACDAITVTYRIDAANSAAAHYPVVLQASGVKGKQTIHAQTTATFDAAKYAYVQATGLP